MAQSALLNSANPQLQLLPQAIHEVLYSAPLSMTSRQLHATLQVPLLSLTSSLMLSRARQSQTALAEQP